MELQFQMNQIPCLRQVKGEVQTQEQTQELRIPDSLPDVGRVLCAWGQVVIRGKEWQPDFMAVNCGVTVWVLYAPEDGSPAQCVDVWIPVTAKWELNDAGENGRILCHGMLKSVDARVVSGRKLMVRATVGILGQAYVPEEAPFYTPGELPPDIRLKEMQYPVCLATETGEKPFMIDEELTLPDSAPAMDKLIRYSLQPEVTDRKVLGDKAVFRGSTLLHILYRTPEGAMNSWDFEIPFSQYTELEQEYGHEAQVHVLPVVTGVEMEAGEQGRLRLKAGLSGQYMIYDTKEVSVIEDAYSPERAVSVNLESVTLPTVLERQSQRIRGEQSAPFGSSRVADIALNVASPRTQRRADSLALEIPSAFQVLYYDGEGVLQAGNVHWQSEMSMGLDEKSAMAVLCAPSGKPTAVPGEESTLLRGEILMDTVTIASEEFPVVTALQVGEAVQKDPHRPSLILRRAGHEDLWSIAKKNGSTVESIREANGLLGEPDPDKMLLIPIL